MSKYFYLALLIIIFSTDIYAKKLFKFNYLIEKGDSLQSIIKQFVKKGTKLNHKDPMIWKIINTNIHIESWRKLVPVQKIILYIKKSISNRNAIRVYVRWLSAKDGNLGKERKDIEVFSRKKGGSLYYIYSSRSFVAKRERSTSLADLNYPVGGGASFYIRGRQQRSTPFYMLEAEYISAIKVDTYSIPAQYMARVSFGKQNFYDFVTPIISFEKQLVYSLDRLVTDYFIRENNFIWVDFSPRLDFYLDSKKKNQVFIHPSIGYTLASDSALTTGTNSIDIKGLRTTVRLSAVFICPDRPSLSGFMIVNDRTGLVSDCV